MTAHAVGQLLLGLAIIIVLARVFGAAAKFIGQPPVIGEILAGILIGPSLLGTVASDRLFPTEIRPALAGLANVGLVLFMFIIGYELDQALVRGRKRVAMSVSIGSVVVPLLLGIALAIWLAPNHSVTRVTPFALFMGVAMSVTAFPVLARILSDRGMLRTEVGGIALASAAVDDVVAWSLLAVVVAIGAADSAMPWQLLLAVPYVVVMLVWVRPALRRFSAARQRAGRLTPNILGAILVGLLLSCYVTELLGLHAIFGAFLFGVVMPRAGAEALRHDVLQRLEQVSVLLLLPVFFVVAGLRVDLSTVDGSGLVELALILLVAITGKFLGAFAGARVNRVGARQASAVAVLMNTRGLTEIVILTVGLQIGVLDGPLFSLMVVMALVTTVMTGPLLSLLYPKRLVERDLRDADRAALGVVDPYRALALLGCAGSAEPVVQLAADLAALRRPGEVQLVHLLRYPSAARDGRSGISSELSGMTRTMGELAALADAVRSRGLSAPVLARFSTDPIGDLTGHLAATKPDVMVVSRDQPGYATIRECAKVALVTLIAQPPAGCRAVFVRSAGTADGQAAVRLAGQLAQAYGVALVVDHGVGAARRVPAVLRLLGRSGGATPFPRTAPQSALVVTADDAATEGADNDACVTDAHVVVRAARGAPRVSQRQPVTTNPGRQVATIGG